MTSAQKASRHIARVNRLVGHIETFLALENMIARHRQPVAKYKRITVILDGKSVKGKML